MLVYVWLGIISQGVGKVVAPVVVWCGLCCNMLVLFGFMTQWSHRVLVKYCKNISEKKFITTILAATSKYPVSLNALKDINIGTNRSAHTSTNLCMFYMQSDVDFYIIIYDF